MAPVGADLVLVREALGLLGRPAPRPHQASVGDLLERCCMNPCDHSPTAHDRETNGWHEYSSSHPRPLVRVVRIRLRQPGSRLRAIRRAPRAVFSSPAVGCPGPAGQVTRQNVSGQCPSSPPRSSLVDRTTVEPGGPHRIADLISRLTGRNHWPLHSRPLHSHAPSWDVDCAARTSLRSQSMWTRRL